MIDVHRLRWEKIVGVWEKILRKRIVFRELIIVHGESNSDREKEINSERRLLFCNSLY